MSLPLPDEEKIRILNTHDLYAVMQKVLLRELKINQLMQGAFPEYFWVLGLGEEQHLLFVELLAQTHEQRLAIEPIKVFTLALQKKASHILLCQSRLNDALTPSLADQDLTDRLIQVGQIVKIPLLDYQLINTEQYQSWQTTGLMETLRQSLKYVPSSEAIQRIQEQAKALLEQRAAETEARIQLLEEQYAQENAARQQEEKRRLAKALKMEGLDLEVIARVLGIDVEDL